MSDSGTRSGVSLKDRLTLLSATGFGLGLSSVASGTTGALLGIALAAALCGLSWPLQAAGAALLAAAAVPVCDRAERLLGVKDDRRIVADEYLTFPLCTIGLPWAAEPAWLAVAFVVSRVLDVVKPPPAFQAQRLPGGWGVAADDAVSSLYALAVNHLLVWAWRTIGAG